MLIQTTIPVRFSHFLSCKMTKKDMPDKYELIWHKIFYEVFFITNKG